MEYLIGALATTVVYLLYDKIKKPKVKDTRTQDEIRQEKETADHWNGLFSYTVDQAYRKVKHG